MVRGPFPPENLSLTTTLSYVALFRPLSRHQDPYIRGFPGGYEPLVHLVRATFILSRVGHLCITTVSPDPTVLHEPDFVVSTALYPFLS